MTNTRSRPLRSDAPAPFRAAAIQFEPVLGDKERNVAALLRLTADAARGGARLIVHPEMATTGYCWASREEIAPFVEPIPGPTTDRFTALAAEQDCYIVVGLPEVAEATGVFYNSAALVGPEGVVGVYRKVHPYISEPKWAKDGDLGFPVFETPLGRIGIAICMDLVFFESTRLLALRGADVVCFPTNWLGDKCPSGTWMARAIENGVYVIAANRYGLERGVQFSGGSSIVGPDGCVLGGQDSGDGIVVAMVDPARARAKGRGADGPGHLLADRRPEAYGNLTLNTYLWDPIWFHGLYGLRPLPPGRTSRVVVGQFAPSPDRTANLVTIERLAAGAAGADLLVLPELSIVPPSDDFRTAEPAGSPFTAREIEILRLIANGMSNQAIAAALSLSHRTVTTHVGRLLDKVGADARTGLAAALRSSGGTTVDEAGATAAVAVLAESIPGAATERLQEIAGRYGLHLVAGMMERDGETLFNSAVLVGPEGVVGVYRKLHLSAADRGWATPGDRGLPTFDLPLGRVGLLIGSDIWFPEATRGLALDGADLIAWPSLVTGPAVQPAGPTAVLLPPPVATGPTPAHVHLWRERARENTTYIAFANGAAPAMGWSGVIGPNVEDNPEDEALIHGAAEGCAELAVDTESADLWGTRGKGIVGLRAPLWYDALQAR